MTNDLPAWAGAVGFEALDTLLTIQSELDWLDYKQQCDLSSKRGVVEFAKDVGAMMITGGYIVIGADDNGRASGSVEHRQLFDPAIIHAKLARFLPRPFEIRCATHYRDGQYYVIIYVAPHPDGFCIFENDGGYGEGKTQAIIFRAGDVFARHGTRSERWNQRDIEGIKQRLMTDTRSGRHEKTEAIRLITDSDSRFGMSATCLRMAVVPENRSTEAVRISAEQAEQFIQGWQSTQTPIDSTSRHLSAYREPGSVVIYGANGDEQPIGEWRVYLFDTGESVGIHELGRPATYRRGQQLMDMSQDSIREVTLIRRDYLEIRLLMLLDVLCAGAARIGVGGWAVIATNICSTNDEDRVCLIKELADDCGNHQGWESVGATPRFGYNPTRFVRHFANRPVTLRVNLTDMRDPVRRLRIAYDLAADLLTHFDIDRPALLKPDGALNPNGAATDIQQMLFQYSQHLGPT